MRTFISLDSLQKPLRVSVCVAVVLMGCAEAPNPADSISGDLREAEPTLPRFNPDKASVSLSAPTLDKANAESTLKVPTLNISMENADHLQLIRCPATFEIREVGGVPVNQLGNSPTETSNKLSAWQEAWERCSIVSTRLARDSYQDIAAPSTRFYYIANPCVSSERSTTGKEACSHDISVSTEMEYDNKLSIAFLEKGKELAETEGALTAHFSRLRYYASAIERKQRSCEQHHNMTLASQANLRGFLGLFATGVGSVVSGYLTGNPFVGGQAANMLSRAAFSTTQQDQQFSCPEVERLSQEALAVNDRLDSVVAKVEQVRNELASMNQQYHGIDSGIRTGGTTPGGTPAGATGDAAAAGGTTTPTP